MTNQVTLNISIIGVNGINGICGLCVQTWGYGVTKPHVCKTPSLQTLKFHKWGFEVYKYKKYSHPLFQLLHSNAPTTMSLGSKAAQRIANKTILITGASSGIGEATAREFASAANGNISLILAARREDHINRLKSQLTQEYPAIKVHSSVLDVSIKQSITEFFDKLPKEFADIDVLINNAGKALGNDQIGNIKTEDIEGMMQTNVLGLINMTQQVMPIFRQKNAGDIVNIGSIAGRDTYPGGGIYCATKSAVKYFSQVLRKETIDSKIRVMEVDPGAVLTEFSLVRYNGDQEKADNVYKGADPLAPEDIAEIIVFGCTRKENTVMADTLVFPSYQAGSSSTYKRSG